MCASDIGCLQVTFTVSDPAFKLDDLLALQLHKFEDEVGEIVDRAQKEEKMENGECFYFNLAGDAAHGFQ